VIVFFVAPGEAVGYGDLGLDIGRVGGLAVGCR
jgi:hypothetical protein